jgi:phosphatidate cytidylyltransferase
VAVAAVAIPIVVLVLYVGDAPLAILLGAAAGVSAWELFRLARRSGLTPLDEIGVPLAAALPVLAHAHQHGLFTPRLVDLVVAALAIMAVALWRRGVLGHPLGGIATTVFGVIYTGGTLACAYALRYHDYAVGAMAGASVVLLPVVLTWSQDTAAFVVGRTIGRHRLMESVSPRKTVEGAVGGLLVTMLVSWVCLGVILPRTAQLTMTPAGALAFGAIVSIAAQIGDLAESLLKREAGVKDSSALLPGHGGMLDRLDSLFFSLPVAYMLVGSFVIPVP